METNIVRRAAVAGGGVFALVAITTGAMAMSSGPAETPATATPAEEPATADDDTTTDDDASQMGLGLCAAGELPELTVERFPDATTPGADTVLEAIQEIAPAAKASADLVQTPFGSADLGAPVWVETGGATYFVDQAPAGGWFASPATLEECTAAVDLEGLQELPAP